jgi:hypothetical protein
MQPCNKSKDGRHNFIVAGGDCFNGCGINQAVISNKSVIRQEKPLFEPPKVDKKMKSIHTREHLLAKDISEAFGEPKKFALYLGTINRVGFERATAIFSEINQSRNIKTPARLFMWKCSKKSVHKSS